MFNRNNTHSKHRSSNRVIASRPRTSPIWRLSALALLSAACMTATAGVTTRVSVDSEGREGNSDTNDAVITEDGRYVAFVSGGSTLVPGDTNGRRSDVFVHDRQTGQTKMVSVSNTGQQSRFGAGGLAMTPDGRFIAFESSDLAGNEYSGLDAIYMYDREVGETTPVKLTEYGWGGGWEIRVSDLSADGRHVLLWSERSLAPPGETDRFSDIYVHDRQTDVTSKINIDSVGNSANGDSYLPRMSANGRYIVFYSDAENLAPPTGRRSSAPLYMHDRTTGLTTLLSDEVDSPFPTRYGDYLAPAISATGRYVVYRGLDYDDRTDELTYGLVLLDRTTGSRTRVDIDSSGVRGNDQSYTPTISDDGRYVSFISDSTNLVVGDTNGMLDVFLRDRQTSTTTRVSVSSTGAQGNYHSSPGLYSVSINSNGRYIAFISDASNLVPGDTNDAEDLFVHDRVATLLEGPYGTSTCGDGLDNDNDGLLDAVDQDCKLPPSPHMCQGKRVTMIGTPGNDIFVGTSTQDVISGLGGDDVLYGAGERDQICGGEGNDKLYGQAGADSLYGGAGNDQLFGGGSNDKLHGGQGVDSCDGGTETDTHLGGCDTLLNTP